MKIRLNNVRIAFCQNLWTAGTMAGDDKGKPAFSCTFLLQKDDPQLKKVKDAMVQAAKDKWAAKWENVYKGLVSEGRTCLKDGETKDQYTGFEGCMYVPARAYTAPLVLDKDKSPLSESSGKPYAGCYVNCSIDIWAMDKPGWGKRICCALKGVQFHADGDAFGGAAPATEADFEDLGSDTDDLI